MRRKGKIAIVLLIFILGLVVFLLWSNKVASRPWYIPSLAMPNYFRPVPTLQNQVACPLNISNPRFYSYVSADISAHTFLKLELENQSDKTVESYAIRYWSSDPLHPGASLPWQRRIEPDKPIEESVTADSNTELSVTIDFVLFTDGSIWCSEEEQSTVKRHGIEAGRQAAARYLLQILESNGADAVMETLPNINKRISDPDLRAHREEYGIFGFISGVNSLRVQLQDAYNEGGAAKVEAVLRRLNASAKAKQ